MRFLCNFKMHQYVGQYMGCLSTGAHYALHHVCLSICRVVCNYRTVQKVVELENSNFVKNFHVTAIAV